MIIQKNNMLLVSVSKIVGASSSKCWSQVHSFKPSGEKLKKFGILLLAVKLDASHVEEKEIEELATVGKEFIQRFHEEYYGSEEKVESVLSHVADCVEKTVEEFTKESELSTELIAGVVLPNISKEEAGVLYISANNPSSSAFLMRGNRIYSLLGKNNDSKDNKEARSISGYLEEGDKFVLGTENFFKLVSVGVLKKAMLFGKHSEVGSILAPHVHKEENKCGVAAVVGMVESQSEGIGEFDEKQETEAGNESLQIQKGRSGLTGVFRDIKERFSRLPKVRSAFSKEEIIVREGKDRQRRLMFSVAFVLLILLGVSVFFGWRRRISRAEEERFNEVWEVSNHQYNEAQSLIELNPLRARALLIDAKRVVEDALADETVKLSRDHSEQLSKRREELVGMLEKVSGEHKIEDAATFIDLSLVRPDTFAEKLALHGDSLVALDLSSRVLLLIDVKRKEAETVGGGTFLKGVKLATVYADRGFVFSDVGVVELSLPNKTSSVAIEQDSEWGQVIDIDAFAGNLYLLSSSQGEIFRYQRAEGGFSVRRRWLGEGVFPDFSNAVSMTIDGDIWVITNDELMKFRRGNQEVLSISGLERPLKDPTVVYTDDESELIYILDKGNTRVLALDKNGEYKAQYIWEGIGAVSDMVVSESEGKILLLSGSTIYEIELKD